jgi:hypothetical protein
LTLLQELGLGRDVCKKAVLPLRYVAFAGEELMAPETSIIPSRCEEV